MANIHRCTHCEKLASCAFIEGKPYCVDCSRRFVQRERRGLGCGCFSIVISAVFLLIVLSALGSNSDTKTPSGTATPFVTSVPTSTPALDDCISWAKYYAKEHMPKYMMLSDVQISFLGGNKYLSIACDMDVMLKDETYIRTAAEFICEMIPLLRDKQGFDHITFLFYGPFIDKYGNDVQSLGMRAMYSRETLQKVNSEYFLDYLYSKPDGVFKAADTYMIHPSYKD